MSCSVFSPLTSEAWERSSCWLCKESCVSTACEKARKHKCVTNRHDMTLAVKMLFDTNTTNLNIIHVHATPLHTHSISSFSLNTFILHRLRNKFLQFILISLDSASWELHQYSCQMCEPMKNCKVETSSRDSNSGPHDCKANTLPHDHRHHSFNNQINCEV